MLMLVLIHHHCYHPLLSFVVTHYASRHYYKTITHQQQEASSHQTQNFSIISIIHKLHCNTHVTIHDLQLTLHCTCTEQTNLYVQCFYFRVSITSNRFSFFKFLCYIIHYYNNFIIRYSICYTYI